jgi:hypothetical protein
MRSGSTNPFASVEQHAKNLQAWHLSLLRFALTLESSDRQQVAAAAREIDQTGLTFGARQDFRYFRKLSEVLCRAVAEQNNAPSSPLYSYIAKIEDARMRRAFAAIMGLDDPLSAIRKPSKSRERLWSGLSPRNHVKSSNVIHRKAVDYGQKVSLRRTASSASDFTSIDKLPNGDGGT